MAHSCTCTVCGVAYEAQRSTSRYCTTRCRTRASRAGTAKKKTLASDQVVTQLPTAPATERGRPHTQESLTTAELEAAGRLNTALGMAAVVLARRIDDNYRETGSGVAALVRQLEATMRSAVAGVAAANDPVQKAKDELALRRSRRRGA